MELAKQLQVQHFKLTENSKNATKLNIAGLRNTYTVADYTDKEIKNL